MTEMLPSRVHLTRKRGACVAPQKRSPSEMEVVQLTPDDSERWHQYGLLRAHYYIDELSFLPESAKNARGEEFDHDDQRSTPFGVFADDQIVGCGRLVHRHRPDERRLPAEEFFGFDAELPSSEASRLIVDRDTLTSPSRDLARISLLRAMLFTALSKKEHYVYATLEPFLVHSLGELGIMAEPQTELYYLTKYNTPNLGARIEVGAVIDNLRQKDAETGRATASFFELGARTQGLGRVTLRQLLKGAEA